MDEQSGEPKEEELMDEGLGIGMRVRLTKR